MRPIRLVPLAVLIASLVGCAGARATPASVDNPSDLPAVQLTDLPPEAATTAALIVAGGPYPYRQDGAVFENREGILPAEPPGWYREYTVPTPGSDDRGARRIVTGQDDHYDSFSWIER
jgi:ribonuclease T1